LVGCSYSKITLEAISVYLAERLEIMNLARQEIIELRETVACGYFPKTPDECLRRSEQDVCEEHG
jgi:Zn ribbon nucleic-acid-binding protein